MFSTEVAPFQNQRWAALEKYRDSDLVAPNVPAPSGKIGDEK